MRGIAIVLITLVMITGCGEDDPVRRIEIGMTVKEVKDILGEPTAIQRDRDFPIIYYAYEDPLIVIIFNTHNAVIGIIGGENLASILL